MARTIAIRITVENAGAIAQTKAMKDATDALTRSVAVLNQAIVGGGAGLNDLERQGSSLFSVFSRGTIAANLLRTGINALSSGIREAISDSIKYEDTLNRTRVIASLSADQIGAIKSKINELGASLGTPITEIATTALEMSKMGVSGDNLAKTIQSVTYLANALGESPVMTGEFVAQIGNAFSLSGDQLVQVADQIAFSTGQSAARINDFKVAFNYAGQAASNANVSFVELAGAMGYLSNQGIKASTMGTGLRRVILELSTDGTKASKAVEGVVGQTITLQQALERLASLNLSGGQLKNLFSLPSLPVVEGLLKNTEALERFTEATDKANGEAQRLGEGVSLSLTQNFGKLKNALIEVVDAFGLFDNDSATTGFTGMLVTITAATANFIKAHKEAVFQFLTSPLQPGKSFEEKAPAKTGLDLKAFRDTAPTDMSLDAMKSMGSKAWKPTPSQEDIIKNSKKSIDLIRAQFEDMEVGGKAINLDKASASLSNFATTLEKFQGNKDALAAAKEARTVIKDIANAPLGPMRESFEVIKMGISDSEVAGNISGLDGYRVQLENLIATLERMKSTKESLALLSQAKNLMRGTDNVPTKQARLSLSEFKGRMETDEGQGRFVSKDDRTQELEGMIAKFKGMNAPGLDKVIGDMEKLRDSIQKPLKKENSWPYQGAILLEHFKDKARDTMTVANTFKIIGADLDKGVGDFSHKFGNDLVNSIVRGKNAFQDFDDFFGEFAKNIISDLVSMIAEFIAWKTIMFGIGLITGGTGPVGLGLVGAGDGLGAGLGSSLFSASGFDGIVNSRTTFTAGEAGPERVSVMPAAKTALGGSGGSVAIHIHGDVHDYNQFQRKVKQAQAMNKKRFV